jgi:cytochrome c-type biogenesis protein CcmH
MQAGANASAMHEMDQAIEALERRLAAQPDDIESWSLLGRSYMSMRRFGDAAVAFRQASVREGGNNIQFLADLGEALALSDPEGLQGEAGAIFERVLAASPAHPKGLWYGGLNAYENANWALADQRLSLLLTLNPPATLIPLLEERIAAARAHAGEGSPMAPAAVAAAPVTPEHDHEHEPEQGQMAEKPPADVTPTTAEASGGAAAGAAAGDGIRLEVTLEPSLAARIPGPTPMFILARNPAGGPPLAVIRGNSADLPVSVTLSNANAMMEGVTITDQEALELVVRVSLSGSPAQRHGDLYGTVDYVRGDNGPVRIKIDRVAE